MISTVVISTPEFSWTGGDRKTGPNMAMPTEDDAPIPPGHEPHDPLNGIRIGALVGGLLGALLTALTSVANAWLVLVGGVVGAIVGYRSQRPR